MGTGVVLKGRLRTPMVLQNPGSFEGSRYLAADGIFREVRLKDRNDLVFLASTEAYPLAEKLRGGIRRLLKSMPQAERAIYLAMLLGDQGEITPAMRQAFARTGTSHLLVINGLHLSMVAAVIYFLSFWVLRRFPWLLLRINVMKVATLLAAAAVVAYAWVAGGSPSTQRAEIMVLAYLLLVLLGRPREVWSALALAALVILSLTPLRLFAISFQLSFVAVAAILYLVPRWIRGVSGAGVFGRLIAGPGSRPLVSGQGSRGGVRRSHPGHCAPGGRLFPDSVASGGGGQPGGHSPGPGVGPAPGGSCGFGPGPVPHSPGPGALALGEFPLWLGFSAIEYAARLPGSAMIVPIPTWLQIAAYYVILILLFAPRRTYVTWAGVVLAGGVMLGSVALPLSLPPQGPGDYLPGHLRLSGRGGGYPGRSAPGAHGGEAFLAGAPGRGLRPSAGLWSLAAVSPPGPGGGPVPERG